MELSFSFTNGKILTIPTTSFVNDFGSLRAIKEIKVKKDHRSEIFQFKQLEEEA